MAKCWMLNHPWLVLLTLPTSLKIVLSLNYPKESVICFLPGSIQELHLLAGLSQDTAEIKVCGIYTDDSGGTVRTGLRMALLPTQPRKLA